MAIFLACNVYPVGRDFLRVFSSCRDADEHQNAKAYPVRVTRLGLARGGAPAMKLPVFVVYAPERRCGCCACECECHGAAEDRGPRLATQEAWTCNDALEYRRKNFSGESAVFRFDEYGTRGTVVSE